MYMCVFVCVCTCMHIYIHIVSAQFLSWLPSPLFFLFLSLLSCVLSLALAHAHVHSLSLTCLFVRTSTLSLSHLFSPTLGVGNFCAKTSVRSCHCARHQRPLGCCCSASTLIVSYIEMKKRFTRIDIYIDVCLYRYMYIYISKYSHFLTLFCI